MNTEMKCNVCPVELGTTERDFDYYINVAKEAMGRSDLLWLSINQAILRILREHKMDGKTLEQAAYYMEQLIGRKPCKNEPTSISNVRATIKAIRSRKDLVLL